MDNYPDDLLTGVFPLVFAVDSTLPAEGEKQQEQERQVQKDGAGSSGAEASPTTSTRSMFDRFLDAIASSLVEEDDGKNSDNRNRAHSLTDQPLSFLLSNMGEEESSSDDETTISDAGSAASKRFRMSLGSPSLSMPLKGGLLRTSSKSNTATAYAKSLGMEGFFRRARINAISTKHGFPPSKDGDGQENRTMQLNAARSAMAMNPTKGNAHRLRQILTEHPIDGILPFGWLEKHVHALPSVLLVVASLNLADLEFQRKQDDHLLETIEHLNESLASKRDCHVRIVCLTEFKGDPSMAVKINEWKARIEEETMLETSLIVVPDDLLQPSSGANCSEPIKELQLSLRSASWSYYQNQSRRAKRKLSMLGHEEQPNLLPLAIRYCFKIGIFYEFQLKHEKSLRYFNEAYRCLSNYYIHLQGELVTSPDMYNSPRKTKAHVNPQGEDTDNKAGGSPSGAGTNDTVADDGIEATLATATPPHTPRQDDGNVEISLVTEDDGETKALVESSPPNARRGDVRKFFDEMEHPPDMRHQCRTVADWLNFKLLQAGFLSSAFSQTEAGILAASAQWRRHGQVFMKRDDPSNPAWNHFAYITQQRHLISQLVERYPPKDVSSLTGLAKDEAMMRCSIWRNYAATAESVLRLGVDVRKAQAELGPTDAAKASASQSSLRGRYVGGFESEGLGPLLQEHAKNDHKGMQDGMIALCSYSPDRWCNDHLTSLFFMFGMCSLVR